MRSLTAEQRDGVLSTGSGAGAGPGAADRRRDDISPAESAPVPPARQAEEKQVAVTTDTIWREFSGQLRSFVQRRGADSSAADDILQEVFIRVHTRLHTLKDTRRLAPWLYAITRNTLADYYRRAALPALPESLAAEENPAGRSGTESAESQIAGYLLTLVKCLPEGYRRAVELHELEGLKQEEVGRRLGLSVSGAKSRIQRGRRMLKDALLDCCHFEFDRLGHVVDYGRRQSCCARHGLCDS
jgi:RNA polymerase sigma-70 factor (ECF subfamily)